MKKYFEWDTVLGTILFLGMTVVSVAFIHYSYAWADEYPVWLEHLMRVAGYAGTLLFPTYYAWFMGERVRGIEDEEAWED